MQPSDFYEALKSIRTVDNQVESLRNEVSSNIRLVRSSYADQIYDLERKRDAEVQDIEEQRDKALKSLETSITAQKEIRDQVNRYLAFIHLFMQGNEAQTPEVTHKREQFFAVKTLREDKYNKIYLYIIPNGNRVNKFSLIIEGDAPLLMEGRRIRIHIKDDSSKEKLLAYIERNLKRLHETLHEVLHKKYPLKTLVELTVESETAIKLFLEQKSWRILYLESRKYYYEERYSGGTDTDMYKDICSLLSVYKKNKKDLVLLAGQMKSDEGRQILENYLKGV
jgi:flagellar hook-associated protein FlgK